MLVHIVLSGSVKASTPKPTVDGEGKPIPIRGSKRLSVTKANAAEGTQENEESEEQEVSIVLLTLQHFKFKVISTHFVSDVLRLWS